MKALPDGERRWIFQRLPAIPESAGTARRHARGFLSGFADNALLDQCVLITSELITNAIKYGRGWRPVCLHIAMTAEHVAVTVTNARRDGDAWQEDRTGGLPPETAEGGRGLPIVRALSDEVTVFHGPVTVVRAARRRGRSQG